MIAIIYVCGDSGKMEPGVRRAPIDLHRAKTAGDEAGALGGVKASTSPFNTCPRLPEPATLPVSIPLSAAIFAYETHSGGIN